MTFPTTRRVGDVFYMAGRRSTTSSTKPLTDKPDKKQTSRKDKQTSREHVPDPPDRTDCFCGSVSIVRIQNQDPYHTI